MIEMLVMAGVGAVIASTMATIVLNQQRELKYITQQSEVNELRMLMTQTFSNNQVCSWQLKTKRVNVANANKVTPIESDLEIPIIKQGLDIDAPILVQTGQPLNPSNPTGPTVRKIGFSKLLATGIANEYQGALEVAFDSKMDRQLKGIQIPLIITVDPADPPNSKRIVGCGKTAAGAVAAGGVLVSSDTQLRACSITVVPPPGSSFETHDIQVMVNFYSQCNAQQNYIGNSSFKLTPQSPPIGNGPCCALWGSMSYIAIATPKPAVETP